MTDQIIAEGKTKLISPTDDPCVVDIRSKDDITAGDGAQHDVLENKAVYATTTTCNCFELLAAHGIPTHYLGRVDEQTFRARRLNMIPLELVARRLATGSYLKRHPDVAEGRIFDPLVVEFFDKDDANHDPLAVVDLPSRRLLRFDAKKPLAEGFIGVESIADSRVPYLNLGLTGWLIEETRHVFTVLEAAWAAQGVALADLKIECGIDVEADEWLVGDVIDNDSWRIWPGGNQAQMLDKQVYRDLDGALDPAAKARELGRIKDNYRWVAEATNHFVS